MIAAPFGSKDSSSTTKPLQVRISPGSGLFCGGRQRTALVMRQFLKVNAEFALPATSKVSALLGKPYLCNEPYNRLPAKSPVNGRPVRFAPCIPGAKPTIKNLPPVLPNELTGNA